MDVKPFPIIATLLSLTALTWYGLFAFLQPASAAEYTVQTYVAHKSLTSAQILNAYSAPIELIPAQGAGKTIIPQYYWWYKSAGTAYATNTTSIWGYGDMADVGTFQALTGTTTQWKATTISFGNFPTNSEANKAVNFSVRNGNPTAGNQNVDLWVYYTVLDASTDANQVTPFPADAAGNLNNDGAGNLSWQASSDSTTDNIAYFMNEHFTLVMTGLALFVMFIIGLWA